MKLTNGFNIPSEYQYLLTINEIYSGWFKYSKKKNILVLAKKDRDMYFSSEIWKCEYRKRKSDESMKDYYDEIIKYLEEEAERIECARKL